MYVLFLNTDVAHFSLLCASIRFDMMVKNSHLYRPTHITNRQKDNEIFRGIERKFQFCSSWGEKLFHTFDPLLHVIIRCRFLHKKVFLFISWSPSRNPSRTIRSRSNPTTNSTTNCPTFARFRSRRLCSSSPWAPFRFRCRRSPFSAAASSAGNSRRTVRGRARCSASTSRSRSPTRRGLSP